RATTPAAVAAALGCQLTRTVASRVRHVVPPAGGTSRLGPATSPTAHATPSARLRAPPFETPRTPFIARTLARLRRTPLARRPRARLRAPDARGQGRRPATSEKREARARARCFRRAVTTSRGARL